MNNPQVKLLVSQLIDWYADRRAGLLCLNLDDIPEPDINALSALILSQDDDLAAEVSGPDNPEFYTTMVPALIKSLNMVNNGFESEYFRDVYNSSIRSYLRPMIERMVSDQLEFLNEGQGCHMSLIWDRASEKAIEVRI